MGDFVDPGMALAHLAALLLVAAMLATSTRSMRMLALAAGVAALVHLTMAQRFDAALFWTLLFVFANAARLAILRARSRVGDMDREERELLEHVLRVEEPDSQRRMLGLLEWRDAAVGEVLIRQGQVGPPLIYIAGGAAAIEHDGRLVGVCGSGDFLGEMSLVSGERATASVTVTNAMRIAVFDRDALAQLARSVPEIRHALDRAVNRGLAAKVLRMNKTASGA